MINLPQKTYYILEYDRFDDLIRKHFQRPDFESVAEYEWSNNCDYTYPVSTNKVDPQDIKDFEAGQYCHWSDLISELINRDVLPLGDYLIEVSW